MHHFEIRKFLKELFVSISRDQTSDQAALLAYWSTLSIFPFAIFLLTLVGYLPLAGLDQEVTHFVYDTMPLSAAKLIDQTVHEIVGKQRGSLLVLSLLGAIWSASGAVSATISSLNRAYAVEETRSWWKTKFIAITMTVCSAIAIIVAMTAIIVGPDIAHTIFNWVGLATVFDYIWKFSRWPLIVSSMIVMTACVYYFLPNVKQKFRIITPGAVIAILLWIGASLGFNLYLSHFDSYAKTYGALGTGVVLMTWLYISAFVIILGGEINAILDRDIIGIHHTEKNRGPITIPDQGKTQGEATENQKAPIRGRQEV
jgi:membrane protein